MLYLNTDPDTDEYDDPLQRPPHEPLVELSTAAATLTAASPAVVPTAATVPDPLEPRPQLHGVYQHGHKWQAMVSLHGEKVYVGTYCTEEHAASAYNHRLIQLCGGVLPDTHALNKGVPPLSSFTACPCYEQEQHEQQAMDAAAQLLSCKKPFSCMSGEELVAALKGTRQACTLLTDKLAALDGVREELVAAREQLDAVAHVNGVLESNAKCKAAGLGGLLVDLHLAGLHTQHRVRCPHACAAARDPALQHRAKREAHVCATWPCI